MIYIFLVKEPEKSIVNNEGQVQISKVEDIIEEIDNLSTTVNQLITDYKTVLNDYLVMNSLAVKHDKFLEVIGIIEFASANDVRILDQTIKSLEKIVKTIKQR